MTDYYFVRVNGETLHNNPDDPAYYVEGEPPVYPSRHFNYLEYCFRNRIVRIGWPDTGDLTANGAGKLARGYDLASIKPHEREYMEGFRAIRTGSVILVPDKGHPGDLYIATVTRPYWYHHSIPDDPYECAHRVGVEWDLGEDGQPRLYRQEALQIPRGGFWFRAFQNLRDIPSGRAAISHIEAARGLLARD